VPTAYPTAVRHPDRGPVIPALTGPHLPLPHPESGALVGAPAPASAPNSGCGEGDHDTPDRPNHVNEALRAPEEEQA